MLPSKKKTAMNDIVTWPVKDLPCPRCGEKRILGYRLDNENGEHMHTHYVCTFWASGPDGRCGWSGWFVPGWNDEENEDD